VKAGNTIANNTLRLTCLAWGVISNVTASKG
jgi:hypothetical protein